jgi:hypothetical protein
MKAMTTRNAAKVFAALSIGLTALSFQNCSVVRFGANSDQENKVLEEEPFVFDANAKVNGVEGGSGNPSENLRVTSSYEASRFLVQDCSAPVKLDDGTVVSRAEYEKQQALAAAASDPTRSTVPVEFAISFGLAEDKLAMWAHRRAILSASSDISIIPVGDKNSGEVLKKDKKNYLAYYEANHAAAREHYIYGRNCFYDTVTLQGSIHLKEFTGTNDTYDFIAKEESNVGTARNIRLMMYGSCSSGHTDTCADDVEGVYGKGTYSSAGYPNRLFGEWPHAEKNQPQIVKLYVADLRESQFKLGTTASPIIRVPNDKERGAEFQMSAKESFDIKTIFRNRDMAIWNLSNDYTTSVKTGSLFFAGSKGVPQLISNLLGAGVSGTHLSSQYTPIVLDLGKPKVKTSSVFDGSFFNMSAKRDESGNYDFPQQTAWLGGDILDMMSDALRNTNASMHGDFRRVTEDGLLVLTNASGKVTSSRDLLGDNTVVNGQTYANGFLALQALAEKDCQLLDTKKRYLGPWDGDLYSKTVKVWVDSNRNGVADSGELKTLKEAGVVAINTCNIVHADATDAYGNGTSLRSAFLYQEDEDITENEEEILNRLEKGVKADGTDASFRLAIDLIFKVNEKMEL